MESIGSKAFAYCENLEEVIILNPKCDIGPDKHTFSNSMDRFDVTICGYKNSTANSFSRGYGHNFKLITGTLSGDANGDGQFNIADLTIFRKFLLGSSDLKISDWKYLDLCEDGVLDAFDYCLMKKKLLENK